MLGEDLLEILFNALTSADFDSFANITNGYMIVEREGLRVMGQFLGVVLFWIPRGMWDSKPVDTGIYIANNRGYRWRLQSADWMAERLG